jgi:hypothetical protein
MLEAGIPASMCEEVLRTLASPGAHLPRPLVALFVARPSKQGNGIALPLLRPLPGPQTSDEVIQEHRLLLGPLRAALIHSAYASRFQSADL